MLIAERTPSDVATDSARYARCIEASKRIRWDIDRDVIRGRSLDFEHCFLPESLARTGRLEFLSSADRRGLNQIQGRTYANMFGLVERFIGAKMLQISRDHWLGDQTALEALVRFVDEELKHQELFRRLETLAAQGMPSGYGFSAQPDAVASAVLQASTWSVLALTLHIELFTQAHYRASIQPDEGLSPLYKDAFHFHWLEESQHATLDELEWRREHGRLGDAQVDAAVDDLIALVSAVDDLVTCQADADAAYFRRIATGAYTDTQHGLVREGLVGSYRWQFIVSGVKEPRFAAALGSMTTVAQRDRISRALKSVVASAD